MEAASLKHVAAGKRKKRQRQIDRAQKKLKQKRLRMGEC
jgi:hypothetical protein